MRLSMFSGLMSVIMAILVLAGGAIARTNAVDGTFAETFENYNELTGEHIANPVNAPDSNAWIAADSGHLFATNAPVNILPDSQRPIPGQLHDTVARLDTSGEGAVTNHLDGSGESAVWLDMNIQMVESDSVPMSPTNDAAIQTAVYLGTNMMLNVLCTPAGTTSNDWVELSGDDYYKAETGQWHRLTVSLSYDANFLGYDYFQVILDGTPLTNTLGWADTAFPGTQGGSWFECANRGTGHTQINMALFSGTGYLDNFVATNGAPTQGLLNGVPGWWLDGYGLAQENSEAGAEYNVDNDMYDAWAEWLLGTDPTSSNSFQLTVESNGGTNYLKWVTDGTIDPNAPNITIHKSTNLLDGYTSPAIEIDRGDMVEGTTNSWPDAAGGDAMYRLDAGSY